MFHSGCPHRLTGLKTSINQGTHVTADRSPSWLYVSPGQESRVVGYNMMDYDGVRSGKKVVSMTMIPNPPGTERNTVCDLQKRKTLNCGQRLYSPVGAADLLPTTLKLYVRSPLYPPTLSELTRAQIPGQWRTPLTPDRRVLPTDKHTRVSVAKLDREQSTAGWVGGGGSILRRSS